MEGEVRLVSAQVGLNFECYGNTFTNRGGRTLSADTINVKGNLLLNHPKSKGELRVTGAKIGGNLDCDFGA